MGADAVEQRVASLEQRLGETFDLLRTLISLVSQIHVESYLGPDGALPEERRRVYEEIREELAALRATLEAWSTCLERGQSA